MRLMMENYGLMDNEEAYKKGFKSFMNMSNKDVLKKNMLFITIFVLLYEYFCDLFIVLVKNKLCGFIDIPGEKLKETDEYKNRIKNRIIIGNKPNELLSTIMWFVDEGVISENEYDIFWKSRATRNRYVHEMENVLPSGIEQDVQLFKAFVSLYDKMDLWWRVTYKNFDVNNEVRTSVVDIMLGTLLSDPEIKSIFE